MKQLVEGIELIGRTKDAGYKDAFYLIKTPDNHYIELSELLFQTVAAMKKEKTTEAVASKLSELQDKDIDAHAVRFLIDAKLEPLGIIEDAGIVFQRNKQNKKTPAPDMLHSLKFRITLLPEKVVRAIAKLYVPLFDIRIMLGVLSAVVGLNIWLFGFHGLGTGLEMALYQPTLFLFILTLILLSSLFHEIGHASAAAYGGGEPGRIGAGVYLIWPAFFSDITDVYRLRRIDRLRSDVGGVYFNLIFSLVIGLVYFITKFEPLLLLILVQNLAVFHQLLPFLRLDGYFIVSDLVGIPDLFTRIGPILQNVFLRKKTSATHDLKSWVKWVVTIWVVITIPLLICIIGIMLMHAPAIVTAAVASAQIHADAMATSFEQQDYIMAIVSALQLVILLLPALGVGVICYLLGKSVVIRINAKMDSYINSAQFDKKFSQPYHSGNGSYR